MFGVSPRSSVGQSLVRCWPGGRRASSGREILPVRNFPSRAQRALLRVSLLSGGGSWSSDMSSRFPCRIIATQARKDSSECLPLILRACEAISTRHCERSEAIHLSRRRDGYCFAALAMTRKDPVSLFPSSPRNGFAAVAGGAARRRLEGWRHRGSHGSR